MMENRVERAINALLDALKEHTLAKFSCAACAVGNIIAYNCGYKIEKCISMYYRWKSEDRIVNTYWEDVFSTTNGKQSFNIGRYIDQAKYHIDSTGFTVYELAEIERVFETVTKIDYTSYHLYDKDEIRQDQMKGLIAVVELIQTFEENEINYVDEFVEKANLIPLNTEILN